MKHIAGEPFLFWTVSKGYDPQEIAAMMSFALYKVDGSGAAISGTPFAIGEFNASTGGFAFNAVFATGWYAIVETLTPAGEALFALPEPLYVYVAVFSGIPQVTESVGGNGSGLVITNFNYGALYTIINGYGSQYIKTLGYPGLNNTGDVFYIGVTDTETGAVYSSFCAHAGSKNFAGDNHLGCSGYLVAELVEGNYADFLSAFNYIEDKYGDLNVNRVITQTVVWALLGAVDVNSEAFANTNLTEAEKAAIIDVMSNYQGYTGNGTVVDLVYMTCETHADDFEYCQPQLIPIYGKVIFENTLIA